MFSTFATPRNWKHPAALPSPSPLPRSRSCCRSPPPATAKFSAPSASTANCREPAWNDGHGGYQVLFHLTNNGYLANNVVIFNGNQRTIVAFNGIFSGISPRIVVFHIFEIELDLWDADGITHIHIYIYTHTDRQIDYIMYISVYIYIHTYGHNYSMFVCMYTYIYIYIWICIYIYNFRYNLY